MGVIYQVGGDGKTMKELYKEVFWDAVATLYLDYNGSNINLYAFKNHRFNPKKCQPALKNLKVKITFEDN